MRVGAGRGRDAAIEANEKASMLDKDAQPHASTRLDALETRAAHQDRIIADLNDTITAQWRKIDSLERQLAQVREALQNFGGQREAPEPPPPHF